MNGLVSSRPVAIVYVYSGISQMGKSMRFNCRFNSRGVWYIWNGGGRGGEETGEEQMEVV